MFDQQISPQCPYCQGTGIPHDMTVRDRERTIKFVCQTCERVWVYGDPPSAPNEYSSPTGRGVRVTAPQLVVVTRWGARLTR
jgi:hypothetical protein